MSTTPSQEWKERLERHPSEFLKRFEDIDGEKPLPSAHLMRRAWEDFGLDGIFYTNQTPYIYFKEVSVIDPEQIRLLHLQLWNQGVAPLLVVISPTEIYIYSGLASPTQNAEEINQGDRLVDILQRTADGLELRDFIRSVELGELFREKAKSFNPKLRVDRDLLRNLEATRNCLLEHTSNSLQDIKTVNALLWRVIFTCYLIDREIIDSSYFSRLGADNVYRLIDLFLDRDIEEVKEYLYKLFSKLQQDFNGDLFDGDLQIEKQQIQSSQIQILKRFLQGDDIKTGQCSLLGFWAYDFKVIPIETISGIYERFIEVEDFNTGKKDTNKESIKRKTGTYYTPRFLAEVTLDVALEGWDSLLDKKFLDPACGSGIFLVALFNRLAEEWRWKNRLANNDNRASALINILQNNIVGIDISETACRIAAFSLYLAFLDQLEPRDIQKLQAQGNVLPMLVGCTILAKNFFDEDIFLFDEKFDLVIGNPPWGTISGKSKNTMELWCKKKKYIIPRRQLASGFVFKAPIHLGNNGRVCLLLPTAVLFNYDDNAPKFQHQWLSLYTIEQVINLADLRFYLFDNADHATLIVRYNQKIPNSHTDYINYVSPKTQPETLRARILTIAPEDQLKIRLKEVLYDLEKSEAPLIWKQSFWGTARDRKFLDRLSTLPRLSDLVNTLEELKHRKQDKRWIIGSGFKPSSSTNDVEKTILSHWEPEKSFLDADNENINLFLLQSDCSPVKNRFQELRRLPKQDIFLAPHIVLSTNIEKVAFVDFDVVFRHTFQGIHGPKDDTRLLIFLTSVLNSDIAKYFLFHTASTWGIGRGDIRLFELIRLPFCLPESTQSPSNSNTIIEKIAKIMMATKQQVQSQILNRDTIIQQAKKRLTDLVYQYYEIDDLEKILIEDTINVWIPSITPTQDGTRSIPTLEISQPSQRQQYTTTLCNLLNDWAKGGYYQIIAKIIVSKKIGAGIVILERVTMGEKALKFLEEDSTEALNKVLNRIISLIPNQQGNISFLRNLKIFDQNQLYIFKPLAYRFWTRNYALNDADEIAAAILTKN
jgi:hypothetical protein